MLGHPGFSYVGLFFLLMLIVPNLIWTKRKPQGYSAEKENRFLALLERAGEALTTCCALMFSDFNLREWSKWSWWLVTALVLMIMYEIWWVRYFKSERRLSDFYSSFFGIPVVNCPFRPALHSATPPPHLAALILSPQKERDIIPSLKEAVW